MDPRTSDPALTDPPQPTRRRVLHLSAAGAGGLLVAACGGDSEQPEPSAGDTTTTPEDTASPSDSDGGAGAALVATADVPVRGGVILESEKVVVTQPAEGEFKAFTAVCTHMSCVVASVKDNRISCACHGSAYKAQDGSVINGPAPRPLKEIAVTVEGDQVVRG